MQNLGQSQIFYKLGEICLTWPKCDLNDQMVQPSFNPGMYYWDTNRTPGKMECLISTKLGSTECFIWYMLATAKVRLCFNCFKESLIRLFRVRVRVRAWLFYLYSIAIYCFITNMSLQLYICRYIVYITFKYYFSIIHWGSIYTEWKMLNKLSTRSHIQFIMWECLQIKLANVSVWLLYSLHLLYILLLPVVFAITQNQLVMPEIY